MKLQTTLLTALVVLLFSSATAQETASGKIDYVIIAEGTDSPIKDMQLVCFNKYFNQDYIPYDFRARNNLNDPKLYKKKMLIEIFRTDVGAEGFDKIDLVEVREDADSIFIEYNLVNSDTTNDDQELAPFLIAQIPKSKKAVKFIVDGVELGKATDLYVK